MTTCRTCSAPVIFGKSVVSGKSVPLDAEPLTDVPANAILLTVEGLAWPRVRAVRENPPPVGTWHLSHFATCPQADDWRKRKVGIE